MSPNFHSITRASITYKLSSGHFVFDKKSVTTHNSRDTRYENHSTQHPAVMAVRIKTGHPYIWPTLDLLLADKRSSSEGRKNLYYRYTQLSLMFAFIKASVLPVKNPGERSQV